MANVEQNWSPPVYDGGVSVSYKVEDGKLIKRTDQGGVYNEIYQGVQQEKGQQQRGFLGGYKVATIAENDLPAAMYWYPELFEKGTDSELRANALVRFSKDPRFSQCIVKRA